MGAANTPQGAPVLRVVSGDATPEELAALVAVLSTVRAPAATPRRRRAAWGDPARAIHQPLTHGPGAWRSSGLPR